VGVSVDASGLLAKIATVKSNIPLALKAVGTYVLLEASQTIVNQGYGAWAPFKKLPKRAHQLLWDTGTLLRSLTPNGASNVLEVSSNSVTVGTNVLYAGYQQDGTRRGIPPRPYLVWDDKVKVGASQVFTKYLLVGV
jgi:phage gpG-like protein